MDIRQGLPEGDEWIDAWLSSISAHTAQTGKLAERVATVSATASSVDGAVEVTVSSSGVLSDLRLDEAVRSWPAERISAEILSVQREAQRQLVTRVAQVAKETVGEQSPTAQAMVAELEARFSAFGGDHGRR
jgi:DNA-binding protein YbaB